MSNEEEINYCKNCGMPIEKGSQFCKGCGSEVPGAKAQEEKKKGAEEKTTTEKIKEEIDGVADEISTTVDEAPLNSIFAIIVGVFGCFTGCFILPIVGLYLVRKGEANNEDQKITNIARILNSVLIGVAVLSLIGIILAIVLPLTVFA